MLTWVKACAEAKALLRQQLRSHPDQGVRLLNEVCEPEDDDPAVMAIARVLIETCDQPRTSA